MHKKNSFAVRLARQAHDRKQLFKKVVAQKIKANKAVPTVRPTSSTAPNEVSPPSKDFDNAKQESPVAPDWKRVRCGASSLKLFSRHESSEIQAQPWARGLVDCVLAAAETGSTHLVLVWPTRLDGLALLHARAHWERVLQRDLRGIRTVLYPGSLATKNSLQTVLLSRLRLSNLFRELWETDHTKTFVTRTATKSEAMLYLLNALNDVRNRDDDIVPQPSFAEVTPTFLFGPEGHWVSTAGAALERTVCKVRNRSWRETLRSQIHPDWANSQKAPGALLVVHNALQRGQLKELLTGPTLRGDATPDVFLLDATARASELHYGAVRRIPEILKLVAENYKSVGSVVVTDDPRTFFALRHSIQELGLNVRTDCFSSEGEEPLFSKTPFTPDWQPTTRTNTYFDISIVDQPASQVAAEFQRLAHLAGAEESPEHRLLIEACFYMLRLSSMPAGYADLANLRGSGNSGDFSLQQNAWGPLRCRLDVLLAPGMVNGRRTELQKAIARAEELVIAWNDATPMAERLLAKVAKYLSADKSTMSIVVPSARYVALAQSFLQRRLQAHWGTVEARIEWHTLYSISKSLEITKRKHHVVFIGVSSDVLRILLTHPAIPHGTTVFMAFKQANSNLQTLRALRTPEAFKAYRGRIGLLVQEIERKLQEMPSMPDFGRLGDFSLTFSLGEGPIGNVGNSNPNLYRFDLDGGTVTYAAGTVYLYVPNEDPMFRRVQSRVIKPGQEIFDMDDEFRSRLEQTFDITGGASGTVNPLRMWMRLYRFDVQNRCEIFYGTIKRSRLARAIHAKMVELDASAEKCRVGRVYYWLDIADEGDTRPHAPSDSRFFKTFCKALQMSSEDADRYWLLARQTRSLNQNLGRELSARYAEIIFQPENALVYQGVPRDVLAKLQADAIRCVRRVVEVHPPKASVAQ